MQGGQSAATTDLSPFRWFIGDRPIQSPSQQCAYRVWEARRDVDARRRLGSLWNAWSASLIDDDATARPQRAQ